IGCLPKIGVSAGANADFRETAYELQQRTSHRFSPPLPYRVDNEVQLQGSGRSLAGADSDDHQASMRGIGRADRIRVLSREHIHMFVEIPPHIAVSDFVRRVKGRSSHRVQMEFPELRKRYWGRHFWA